MIDFHQFFITISLLNNINIILRFFNLDILIYLDFLLKNNFLKSCLTLF